MEQHKELNKKEQNINGKAKLALASRKFKMALLCLFLLIGVGLFVLINPIFIEVIPSMISGIVAILGLYCSGNVGEHWVLNRNPTPKGDRE